MKRVLSMFMICLALINFSACTKHITTTPNGGGNTTSGPNNDSNQNGDNLKPDDENQNSGGDNGQESDDNILEDEEVDPRKLSLYYVDLNGYPTDSKTDTIMMSLKEGVDGFHLLSKKSGNNEYTAQLIDTENKNVISMMYKDNAKFPYKITVFDGKDVAVGTTTKHRLETEDYDILWGPGDDTETTIKIPLNKDIYNYLPHSQFDTIGNYQINTMLISFQIWTSFSDYIKDQPVVFGFWKKFFKVFLAVVAIVIAVVAAPIAVALAPVIGVTAAYLGTFVVVGGSAAGIMTASNAIKLANTNDEHTKDVTNSVDMRRKVINIKTSTSDLNNGDTIQIPFKKNITYTVMPPNSRKNSTGIYFSATELTIQKFNVKVFINGEENSSDILGAYFRFFVNNEYTPISQIPLDGYFIKGSLGGEHYIIIQKKSDIPSDIGDIFLKFEIGDENVIVNDLVLTDNVFTLRIK